MTAAILLVGWPGALVLVWACVIDNRADNRVDTGAARSQSTAARTPTILPTTRAAVPDPKHRRQR